MASHFVSKRVDLWILIGFEKMKIKEPRRRK